MKSHIIAISQPPPEVQDPEADRLASVDRQERHHVDGIEQRLEPHGQRRHVVRRR
jgi:hypothetical protein